jgi:hypothetical protein
MKLCKDCRHINQYAQCTHPDIPMLDVVNGNHHVWYCQVARSRDDLCGFDAKLFAAKLTDSNDEASK